MTTFMEDAVNVQNLDPTSPVVAVYLDGAYATTQAAVRARCPNSAIVWITVLASPRGMAYDCETGNGTPQDAVSYAQERLALGYTPIVYCGEHTWWSEIEQLMAAAGLEGKVIYWVADYDGVAQIPVGADGKQYADPGPVDLSVVDQTFLEAIGADPPAPPPPPSEDLMVKFTYGNPEAQFVSNGLHYEWIPNGQGVTNYDTIFHAEDLGAINGLVGMGVPTDPTTARMSGQPWPPTGPAQP